MADGSDDLLWYFAYGSNMQRSTFFGRRKMAPAAWHAARLEGYRLCFDLPIGPGERGVANIVAAPGHHVYGVAFQITPAQFDFLDTTEGVPLDVYARVAVSLHTTGSGALPAFTYCSRHSAPGRKPSARYLGLLVEGAREHTLPDEYIRFLESFALAVDERESG